jgi:hypothetical protein
MFVSDPTGVLYQVDANDWPAICEANWRVTMNGGSPYVVLRKYDRATRRCRTTALHRHLMGARPGEFVDHANGNTLDNRRSNLRLCTKRQNQQNSRKRRTYDGKPTKNRLKGTHPTKQGKWTARIRHTGKYHYLGTFDTELEAYSAYCSAADLFHGEFARVA